MCRFEDKNYLHVVDRGIEQREVLIIDKRTGEITRNNVSTKKKSSASDQTKRN